MCLKRISIIGNKSISNGMANIGTIPIDLNGNLDSGIAQLLIKCRLPYNLVQSKLEFYN